MFSTVVPLALYLGAPLTEVPEALDLERLLSPFSIGSGSGTPGSFKGFMVAKVATLGPLHALVTDETFCDHET